jgi:hypothetical protein
LAREVVYWTGEGMHLALSKTNGFDWLVRSFSGTGRGRMMRTCTGKGRMMRTAEAKTKITTGSSLGSSTSTDRLDGYGIYFLSKAFCL